MFRASDGHRTFLLYTQDVGGSSPSSPTLKSQAQQWFMSRAIGLRVAGYDPGYVLPDKLTPQLGFRHIPRQWKCNIAITICEPPIPTPPWVLDSLAGMVTDHSLSLVGQLLEVPVGACMVQVGFRAETPCTSHRGGDKSPNLGGKTAVFRSQMRILPSLPYRFRACTGL